MYTRERVARVRDSLDRLERGVQLVEKDPQDGAARVLTSREVRILLGRVMGLWWDIIRSGIPPAPDGPESAGDGNG